PVFLLQLDILIVHLLSFPDFMGMISGSAAHGRHRPEHRSERQRPSAGPRCWKYFQPGKSQALAWASIAALSKLLILSRNASSPATNCAGSTFDVRTPASKRKS